MFNIVDAPRNDDVFLAVVRLYKKGTNGAKDSICTGTFVSDNAVLTAAHCIDASPTGGMYLAPGKSNADYHLGAAATKVYTLRSNGASGYLPRQDFAILIFPDCSAPAVMKLSAATPAIGASIDLIGFGLTVLAEDSYTAPASAKTYAKYYGHNKVTETDYPGYGVTIGGNTEAQGLAGAATGAAAMVSLGDSGGPLVLADGSMTGVLSTVAYPADGGDRLDRIHTAEYIDLHQPIIRGIIDSANLGGAGIAIPSNWVATVVPALDAEYTDTANTSPPGFTPIQWNPVTAEVFDPNPTRIELMSGYFSGAADTHTKPTSGVDPILQRFVKEFYEDAAFYGVAIEPQIPTFTIRYVDSFPSYLPDRDYFTQNSQGVCATFFNGLEAWREIFIIAKPKGYPPTMWDRNKLKKQVYRQLGHCLLEKSYAPQTTSAPNYSILGRFFYTKGMEQYDDYFRTEIAQLFSASYLSSIYSTIGISYLDSFDPVRD